MLKRIELEGLGKDGIADAVLTSGGTPAVCIYVTKLIVENPVYGIEILILTVILVVPFLTYGVIKTAQFNISCLFPMSRPKAIPFPKFP